MKVSLTALLRRAARVLAIVLVTVLAVRVWEALGFRDYARVDFRMNGDGRIYVLEANPNPDISVGSGYRLSLDAAKITYPDFVARLVENAISRRRSQV